MHNRFPWITCSLILWTQCPCPRAALAAPEKPLTVWKVEQVSNMMGPLTIFIGDSAIKAVCPLRNLIWYSEAPSWRSSFVNTKIHIGVERDLKLWAASGLHVLDDTGPGSPVTTRTTWGGRPAVRVICPVRDADPVREQLEMVYEESPGRSLSIQSEEMTYSDIVHINDKMRIFLSGIYNNCYVNGLLVEDTRVYSNGKRYTALATKSVKQVQINASDMRCPTGFKVVQDVRRVIERDKQVKDTSAMMKDFFEEDKNHPQ